MSRFPASEEEFISEGEKKEKELDGREVKYERTWAREVGEIREVSSRRLLNTSNFASEALVEGGAGAKETSVSRV
jgi:hypothetical protein